MFAGTDFPSRILKTESSEPAKVPIETNASSGLPEEVDTHDYSGSLVNVIAPYAFWKQAVSGGHKGVLITAGASATGIATVYSYGVLGKESLFTIDGRLLMAKDLTLKGFSNFRSATVRNPLELDTALQELSEIIAMPHFRTKRGESF